MKKPRVQPNNQKARILVVEDDPALRSGLGINLRMEGYEVLLAEDGEEGMRLAFDARPDLMVLDIMMPCWTGLDILEELRKRQNRVPVLILSALRDTSNKVEGLIAGADDYMTKPFDLPELIARIQVMLRRTRIEQQEQPDLVIGDLCINRSTRSVSLDKQPVELSAKEFDLLRLLAESPGKVFSRDEILERIWGWDYEGTSRTVDNFIASLRKKLLLTRNGSVAIQTIPRIGYKLSKPDRP